MERPHLSLREERSGGKIRETPEVSPAFLRRARRKIIAIHGFRTDAENASLNYRAFRDRARRASETFHDDLMYLEWPGDIFTLDLLNWFNVNVENAIECGRRLGAFLAEIDAGTGGETEYVFVSHSLGCRLVLAMLAELDRQGVDLSTRFKVFFLAAAVPEEILADETDESRALERAAFSSNLFSRSDGVLGKIFWLNSLRFQRAVGWSGNPAERVWNDAPQHMMNYHHDTYWPDGKGEITRYIARRLGYYTERPESPARESWARRGAPERQMPERVMAERPAA